jgi:hypothetical protein
MGGAQSVHRARRELAFDFHHYDFYSQCLAKIERGHRKDLVDVDSMLGGLVEPRRLAALFEQIEPDLYRYPAIDAATLPPRGPFASRPTTIAAACCLGWWWRSRI